MTVLISLVLIAVIFALLFVILVFVFFAIDLFFDELPYVATQKDKLETIIAFAEIKKGQTAVDLGSGDGRLLYAAAKKGAFAIGYELNPFLVILTRYRAKIKGLSDHILVRRQNLWHADLRIADIIFVYGRKRTMQKFENFVFKNASPKTRIIVNTNPFPSKKSQKVKNQIFIYEV